MGYNEDAVLASYVLSILLLTGGCLYCFNKLDFSSIKNNVVIVSNMIVAVVCGILSYFIVSVLSGAGLIEPALRVFIFLAAITAVYFAVKLYKNTCNKTWFFATIAYMIVLAYITGFSRIDGNKAYHIKFDLLHMLGQNGAGIGHFLLNVAMFVPVGFLLPLTSDKKPEIFKTALAGMLFSAIIESTQLTFLIGECDIADIVGNTLGALIGAVIVTVVVKIVDLREL